MTALEVPGDRAGAGEWWVGKRGTTRGPSPPTAATARPASRTTCTNSACARGHPAQGPALTHDKPTNTAARSAAPSSGAPAAKPASATLKRQYGWDRTRLDGLDGARIWTGHGVLAHNLVKIAALTA